MRAQHLAQRRHDDDDGEVQRLPLTRDLPAGQDTPVDEGELGAHRQPHGRDEAEGEDRAVAGRLEEFLHVLPRSRRRHGGHLWRVGTATQFAVGDRATGADYRDVPPDVTTGRDVVVVGGVVVVVVVVGVFVVGGRGGRSRGSGGVVVADGAGEVDGRRGRRGGRGRWRGRHRRGVGRLRAGR